MFEKVVVIDCRGHLLGRLASIVAKELLCGQRIVALRCEGIEISGSSKIRFKNIVYRNKVRFASFLRKRMNTNPKKGPIHFKSPSKIFWRTVRGMLPHKTPRGSEALKRLQVYEGIPPTYEAVKRMVVPQAVRASNLKPNRKYTVLGELATMFGYTHLPLINKLEDKRRARALEFYKRKIEAVKATA